MDTIVQLIVAVLLISVAVRAVDTLPLMAPYNRILQLAVTVTGITLVARHLGVFRH